MTSTGTTITRTLAEDDSLAAGLADLEAAARAAWVHRGRASRWTLWMRLSWAWPVSEHTAHEHVEEWASSLRRRVPGTVILVGFHTDAERRHAHVLLFVPRQGAPKGSRGRWLRGIAVTWHSSYWQWGKLWLDLYRPGRRQGSAVTYLSKDPASVELYGTPVRYVPRRTR